MRTLQLNCGVAHKAYSLHNEIRMKFNMMKEHDFWLIIQIRICEL